MSPLLRLLGMGWVLLRLDALLPREITPLLPQPLRLLAHLAHLFAGGEARRGRPGERLARAFERLGPVAIKLGQLLSTRGDVFGAQFAEDLSHLKDRLPPFPQAQAEAEIARQLARPPGDLFAAIEPPVAAASLAQAHPARLHDGRRVAVKVLRPGIEPRVIDDLAALRRGAALAERWAPLSRRLEPRATVATVAKSMALELDLRMEAAAASELETVMAADPYMRAPAVVWEGVGQRVLTLEWADGVPLSNALVLSDAGGFDRVAIGVNLVRAFLAQALDHGVFHADLHEGNLFVTAPAALTAVDFGIVGRLGPAERRYLAEILYGFIRRDYGRIAEMHFQAGYVPATESVDEFAQALRAVGEPIWGLRADRVSMGRLLTELFEVTARFGMHLRPELILLQKTMVTVEGVARRIDPQHDLWAAAQPIVERWIRRELSPPAQARRRLEQAGRILDALARHAEVGFAAPVIIEREPARLGWAALGLAAAALGFAAAALFHPFG